jgi:hypothetical protein
MAGLGTSEPARPPARSKCCFSARSAAWTRQGRGAADDQLPSASELRGRMSDDIPEHWRRRRRTRAIVSAGERRRQRRYGGGVAAPGRARDLGVSPRVLGDGEAATRSGRSGRMRRAAGGRCLGVGRARQPRREHVNVSPEALPPGARLATWRDFDLQSHAVDATFQVGYHPRGGVEGFLSHTYLPGLRLRMDEELISETHGRVGVGSPASRHRGQRSPPANDRFSLGDALSRCAEVSRPQCGAATLER